MHLLQVCESARSHQGVSQRTLSPCCNDHAERNWSVYGKIKSDNRTRLGHHKSDKLVYCHEALHLKLKLQKASHTQETIKWESDSDDDDDEEEADLMF